MKNGTRIFLICLIIVLLLGYVVGFVYCTVNKYASAEEIPENEQILNFNQLFNNNTSRGNYNNIVFTKNGATYTISGSFTGYTLRLGFNEASPTISITNGHKYYLDYKLKVNSGNTPAIQMFNSGGTVLDSTITTHIFTASSSTTVSLGFFVNTAYTYNFSVTPMLIDLTAMYGINSEPDLETCQNLFQAEYYSYSTGFPITLSGIAQYNNALNDIFQNYKFMLDRNALSTQTQATDLMGTLSGTITFAYNDENWYIQGAMYSPLFTLITAGSEFNIELQLYAPSGREERFICFGAYVDGELNEIYKTTHIGDGTTLNINFTTPVDVQTLYVYERNGSTQVIQSMNYIVGAFNIKVEQLDVAAAVMSSYSTGYNTALEYYSRGSRGYSEIFEQGRQSGLAESVGTITAMDYVRMAFVTIGEILMIEVFPNFTLGAFFLLPLITSAIFFIMRIAKGG